MIYRTDGDLNMTLWLHKAAHHAKRSNRLVTRVIKPGMMVW